MGGGQSWHTLVVQGTHVSLSAFVSARHRWRYIFSPSAVGSITSEVGSLLCGYGFGVFCALRSIPSHMIASSTFVMARLRSRDERTG